MRSLCRFYAFPFARIAAGLALLLLVQAFPAFAGSDRQPVILDTQTGIHDGRSGVVLQNAPLVSQPMVAAQPTASLQEFAPQQQPAVIVAPYVEVPGGAPAAVARPVLRPRLNSGQ